MNKGDVERLRKCEGSIVKITCSDGEILEAKIVHVDDEYSDVIYDLISSTANYPKGRDAAYVVKWDDILDFNENPK